MHDTTGAIRRLLAVILSFCALSLAEAAEINLSAEQVKRLGVATKELGSLRAAATALELPAQVVVPPGQLAVLAAPLPALVTRVHVAYGEQVRAGQILAELQGPALLEAQSAYAQAQSQAVLASENRQRDENLLADGIIPQSRLSASRALERQASVLAAEKRRVLQFAGVNQAGVAVLRAPFAGVVLEANAAAGAQVDALTPLFKLGRVDTLWLEIQANPAQAAWVPLGAQVGIAGCSAPARVTLVAPAVQSASQSVLVRAELTQVAGCVKPFAFVQARVQAPDLGKDQWQVPLTAVLRHQGKTWLFVAQDQGFRAVPVRVLAEGTGSVRIAADLPPTAQVVTRGVAALKGSWLGLGQEE